MSEKRTVQVQVSKPGPNGHPQAQVFVDSKISAASLGGLIQKVVTHEGILKAGGLGACGGCKSGLDVNIFDQHQIFQVEV